MASIPVPYIGQGNQSQTVLGHYAVAQASGAVTGTLAANAVLGSIRWAPTLASTFLVLQRIKVGYSQLTTGAGTAPNYDVSATIARGFSVDFTTAATAINLATVIGTNSMRSNMANSQMGANGPRIATTVTQSGQTYTLDTAPFAVTPIACTTLTNPAGNADLRTLYEWTGLGQHPVVLSNNMGISLRWLTGFAISTSTTTWYTQWEWAEVLAF